MLPEPMQCPKMLLCAQQCCAGSCPPDGITPWSENRNGRLPTGGASSRPLLAEVRFECTTVGDSERLDLIPSIWSSKLESKPVKRGQENETRQASGAG